MSDTVRDPELEKGTPVEGPGGQLEPDDVDLLPEGAERVGSLASDAWRSLRRSPMFIISTVLILFFVVMAIAPGLFTGTDPQAADLTKSRQPPSSAAWFGYDVQGSDIYARTIYGARASIVVGLLATLGTVHTRFSARHLRRLLRPVDRLRALPIR